VQEALEAAQVGRTSITIAHRLSTIKAVDKIFVIEVRNSRQNNVNFTTN
jgi:ATP-binding cassette subfamily B protein